MFASFVFCFASSSIFRREVHKLLNKHYKPKHSIVIATSEVYSGHENRPFLQQTRLSEAYCPNGSPSNENALERKKKKQSTESTIETDGFI
jgi:hypothetical protein